VSIDHYWQWSDAFRLLVALILGATIGLERELHDKPAGLKTISLVTLSGALMTLFSLHLAQLAGGPSMALDITRIPAAVMTGIGFLGAGTIIREGISVRGLTTAGSLWIVAAIGMASGAGYYWPAVAGTALTVFALWPLRALAYFSLERFRPPERRLVVELKEGSPLKVLLDALPDVRQIEVEDQRDRRVVTLELVTPAEESLVTTLSDREDVIAVRWRR